MRRIARLVVVLVIGASALGACGTTDELADSGTTTRRFRGATAIGIGPSRSFEFIRV